MRRFWNLAALAAASVVLASCNGSNNGGSGVELDSGSIGNGSHYDHTFNTAGSFPYKCTIHSSCTGLQGTVVVVDAATPIANSTLAITQGDGGTCFTLSAATDTVHVGQTVRWTNASASPHTVTTR